MGGESALQQFLILSNECETCVITDCILDAIQTTNLFLEATTGLLYCAKLVIPCCFWKSRHYEVLCFIL